MVRSSLLAVAAISLSAPAFAQGGMRQQDFIYRGFRIDMSAIPPGPRGAALRRAATQQVDIVARAPLPPRIAQWIRNVPIKLMPGQGTQPGLYTNQPMLIRLWLRPQLDARPLLLHELMHAVHARILPNGVRNAQVLRFYGVARQRGLWPGQYVMKNEREYFAVTASLILNGTVDREPRTAENLARLQPRYVQWLRGAIVN